MIADTYAENYVPMFRKAVRQAFLAGITFDNMISKGDITKDMICKDFFRILDEEMTAPSEITIGMPMVRHLALGFTIRMES